MTLPEKFWDLRQQTAFLKNCRKQLAKPLYYLWRGSLDNGVIPSDLLLVIICPVFKGGSRGIPKNYRPVALTSHIVKVFERVIRKSLIRHLEENSMLPDGQHGFRSLRSTLTQLMNYWDGILENLENGGGVDSIYLDFSKAFDKVETGVLLHKLLSFKIRGKVGCWLASFLDAGHCRGWKDVCTVSSHLRGPTGDGPWAGPIPLSYS